MPRQDSLTRSHFEKIDDSKVKCKHCSKEIKTGGGTSNKLAHLKRAHPLLLLADDESVDENQVVNSPVTVNRLKRKQYTIDFPSDSLRYYENNDKRKKRLDEKLTIMIATDFQPFSIVNDIGFQKFVHELDPRYELSNSKKVRHEFLPQIYINMKNKLQFMLSKTQNIALTTDVWTSDTTEAFLTVTCHFIFDAELRSATLNTVSLPDTHTSENLANHMRIIMAEWNIREKVEAITTDNAAAMIKMCELLQIRNMPCFAHSLNLAVEDSLKDNVHITEIIDKTKRIVKYFRKSTTATTTLNKEQMAKNPEAIPLKLKQEVATRWNSVYFMLERVILLWDCIILAISKLPNSPVGLNANEKNIIEDVVKIYAMFDQSTKIVSGQKYVTSSLIIPIVCGMFDNLNKIEPNIATEEGKQLIFKVRESISRRLLNYELRTITRVTTFLDPRFKTAGFRQNENAQAAKEVVLTQVANILSRSRRPIASTCTSENQSGEPQIEKPHLFDFLKKRNLETTSRNTTADAIITIRHYTESPPITFQNTEYNVISFWQSNKHLQPLDEIALKYLCISATSVPSERVFSAAGYTISSRRNRLKNDAVDMLLFLNLNKRILSSVTS